MSLCLHLEMISFRLFRDLTGSAREIRVFSIKQSLQSLVFLLYEGARDNMDQADVYICTFEFLVARFDLLTSLSLLLGALSHGTLSKYVGSMQV